MPAGIILLCIGLAVIVLSVTERGYQVIAEGFKSVKITIGTEGVITSRSARFLVGGVGVICLGLGAYVVWRSAPVSDSGGYRVTIPEGGGTTNAYTGPSSHGYSVNGTVSANTSVHIICTVYGEPLPFGTRDALWDYTNLGWLNDHFVSTGVAGPTASGCTGTTGRPSEGMNLPTRASGPYAVIADEGQGVPVRAQPTQAARTVGQLSAFTFVRLRCSVTKGPVIPAPRALGSTASNNVWDRIVNPNGWVPDSYVATYSVKAVAPSCG